MMAPSRHPILLLYAIVLIFQIIHGSRSYSVGSYIGRSGYSDTHYHHPHHGHIVHHSGGHSSGFQSIFDIALTGLAFLSFGIFLLNLLLNALGTAGVATGTVLPTNTGTGIITSTATGTGRGIETMHRIGKRSVPFDLYVDPVISMDTLAHEVLKSIDAMLSERECLQKVICDGNKKAKLIRSGFQFMMPAYSLAASYIGKKAGFHNCFPDHVKAVILGLEETNCKSHFPRC